MASSRKSQERRKSRRRAVKGIKGSFLLSADARVLNMSVEGMALEARNPLKVGRDYSLKLAGAEQTIPLVGRVVWCSLVRTLRDEEGEVQPVYRAGVHFESALQGTAADLQSFIAQNAIVSLEKRLFGRFRLQGEREASVEYEASFRVLELSLSGMLIETDQAPPVDTTHRMEIQFPEFRFVTEARIVRSERAESDSDTESRHRLGIEFLELDPEAEKPLAEFILAESD